MTWNELAELIEKMPADVRLMQAEVWTPEDFQQEDDFSRVVSLTGYDAEEPISLENLPAISVAEA